ncbi:MAG: NAD-dependent epimerase/dehydratase family protein [Legionella sp.]
MISVVTGATGCLGLSLTQRLVQEGHHVLALGRDARLGALINSMGAQFIPLDLNEKKTLQRISQPAQYIFHCAALSSPWGSYKQFYETNVIGTQNVIDATPRAARLIHVSSPSIYFDYTEQHNIKENKPLPSRPANNYVKTKLLAEQLIDNAQQQHNLNVITLRPRAIFGPYDRSILPRLLRAEKKGIIPLIGTGENIIDVTFVENVVESLILAAQVDNRYSGRKYNITNDEPTDLITIISSLFHALNKPLQIKYIPYATARYCAQLYELIYRLPFIRKEPAITRYSAAVLALGQTLNIDAAKKDLGYQPHISIDEGMARFARWYQS